MIRPLPESPFLLTSEVADLFGVDTRTVQRWVRQGKLHPVRTPGGHLWRYSRDQVEQLLSGRSNVMDAVPPDM